MKNVKKRLISGFVKIVIYGIFLFGLYVADRIYPSLFTWYPYYEPAGIQYLLIVFISLPTFIITEILLLFFNKICDFSKNAKYLPLIAVIFIILPLTFNTSSARIFGTAASYAITLIVASFFIYDALGFKIMWDNYKTDKSRIICFIVIVLALLIGVVSELFYKQNTHYFRYNIAWNTGFSNLTEDEKRRLLSEIFATTDFNVNAASRGLHYTFSACPKTISKDGLEFIKQLEKICDKDILKLGVLHYELNKTCYKNLVGLSRISIDQNTAQNLLLTMYKRNKFHAETVSFILDRYVVNKTISREKKLEFFWELINNYPHKYQDFLYEINRMKFEMLVKYFFDLKPQEYRQSIVGYINNNKNDFMKSTMIRYNETLNRH